MKVLHLPYGGQMTTICSALREIGVDATSCHFNKSNFHFKPDICLHLENVKPAKKDTVIRDFLKRAVAEYDIFHFHFGLTFFADFSDLEYLRSKGKKIVVQHRGSDVRRLSIARQFGNPYVQVKYPNERLIEAKLRKLAAFIDHAIVADYELLPYIQNYYKHIHLVRQAIDVKKYTPSYPSTEITVPVIVHAPSHPMIKGTEYVSRAAGFLAKQGYPLELRILRRVPHDDAIRIYKSADLIVDQMRIGSFGIFSLEGMALGKPVVCYIREGLTDTYPEGLPIVNANPDNLGDKLKELLSQPKKRRELGQAGRDYVEKHHNAINIARQLAELYRHL